MEIDPISGNIARFKQLLSTIQGIQQTIATLSIILISIQQTISKITKKNKNGIFQMISQTWERNPIVNLDLYRNMQVQPPIDRKIMFQRVISVKLKVLLKNNLELLKLSFTNLSLSKVKSSGPKKNKILKIHRCIKNLVQKVTKICWWSSPPL